MICPLDIEKLWMAVVVLLRTAGIVFAAICFCGCNGKNKEGHGPYWYSYKNGKRQYVGKRKKAELHEINKKNKFMQKNKDMHLPYQK